MSLKTVSEETLWTIHHRFIGKRRKREQARGGRELGSSQKRGSRRKENRGRYTLRDKGDTPECKQTNKQKQNLGLHLHLGVDPMLQYPPPPHTQRQLDHPGVLTSPGSQVSSPPPQYWPNWDPWGSEDIGPPALPKTKLPSCTHLLPGADSVLQPYSPPHPHHTDTTWPTEILAHPGSQIRHILLYPDTAWLEDNQPNQGHRRDRHSQRQQGQLIQR